MSAPASESRTTLVPEWRAEAARTLLIAASALLVVLALFWLALWLIGAGAPVRAPARSPFGVSPREMAPSGGAIAGWLLAMQSQFYRSLTGAIAAMRQSGAAPTGLIWIGFLYGVFHAAGPGHGKAVVAGYIVANERALARGLAISFAAAALQAIVAIALVAVMSLALGATARQMDATANVIEMTTFVAMSGLGAWLLWTKARRLALLAAPARPVVDGADDCSHMHAPPSEILSGAASPRAWIATVIAAGARPCSGAIILLVFALAQGMFGAGVAGVIAMAAGTALTTSALAALAVFFKQAAVRLASGRGRAALYLVAFGETLAAAIILVVGAALALGVWSGGGG